jgi:hypothetical protein
VHEAYCSDFREIGEGLDACGLLFVVTAYLIIMRFVLHLVCESRLNNLRIDMYYIHVE